MKPSRLDQLSDGIFAIIITLLAFDLKFPLIERASDRELIHAIQSLFPIFMSFVLSFAVLFTYWRAHHYIASVYARTINTHFTSINAVFFFFISLIPFSTRLLGEYSYTRTAIVIYGLNIICIGLSLLWMRNYVLHSTHIEHTTPSHSELRRGVIRTIVPMLCALVAMALCFYSTTLALVILTLAIVFNLFSRTTREINKVIEHVVGQDTEIIPEKAGE